MLVESEELSLQLNQIGCSDLKPDVLNKIIEMCVVLDKNAEDISNDWCAFALNKGFDITPTIDKLDELERELTSKKLNIRSIKTPKQNSMVPPIFNASSLETSNLLDSYSSATPKRKKQAEIPPCTPENRKLDKSILNKSPFSPISNSHSPLGARDCSFSARYQQRTSKGDILCSLGKPIGKDDWMNKKSTEEVNISLFKEENSLTKKFSYMFSKQRDRCFILNDLIEEFEELYLSEKEKFGIDFEEFDHVRLPNPDEKHVIGRIFSEGDGKINTTSIFLEGSFNTSSGQTIPLDITPLKSYVFFPGQIIAATGLNTTGNQFVLKNLLPNIYPPSPTERLQIKEHLDIVVACGPFTTIDSMAYEPLTDLVSYVKSNNPQICVLIGPFIDIKPENIMTSISHETAQELFVKQLNTMADFLVTEGGCQTKFVVVSSHKDLHHDCVYPSAPYCPKLNLEGQNRFSFYSDPCLININGVLLGITGVDILFHLAKEEAHLALPLDRMSHLLDMILSQRSFYPLYPPNIDLFMDMEQFEKYGKLSVLPHVLITPSDLRCFAKTVQGCCCVNPEKLAKGMVGGSYGRIRINRSNDGLVIDNISAEVVRI